MKRQKWIFVLLNIFIVFQLTVMVLTPNRSSVLHDIFGPYINWYSVPIHFIHTWAFFSPDPAIALYWEYSYIYDASSWQGSEDSMYEKELITHVYPSVQRAFWSNNYIRNMYFSRYAAINEKHFNGFFLPWLCRQEDNIDAVSLEMKIQLHHDLDASKSAQSSLKQAQTSYTRFMNRNIYSCKKEERNVLF